MKNRSLERAPRNGDDPGAVPVVGVGASAGGLEAFGEFLSHLPPDTGMAFVLIQHLAPTHVSQLPEILAKKTTMPIEEARDGTPTEANHVYVVGAGTEIRIVDGTLTVAPRESTSTIDHFFESLAEAHRERAIGVVLAGTGSDGTLGALAIRGSGGLVFAQDPATCQHDGMPRSAIAAGAVDGVLAPGRIGPELARIAGHVYMRTHVPAGRDGQPLTEPQQLEPVLAQLRAVTGVSFEGYKSSTIMRRLMRRMALHSIERIDDYARLLRNRPDEARALFGDLLIHVSSFFRDPDVFDLLGRLVFPELVKRTAPGVPLKIWVPGCATGEEAFSIAIALEEYLGGRRSDTSFQVFATDLDDGQITRARASTYPRAIAAHLSPERLRRYFVPISGGYRVSAAIRDHCVFARHNLLNDPPFSRVDLVSCRNVMIYFGTDAQKRLVPLFHYALNPGGYLLLGSSESIGSFEHLFDVVDRRHKLYARRDGPTPHRMTAESAHDPARIARDRTGPDPVLPATSLQRRTDEFLARKFAPPAVVVDGNCDILQFRGDTTPFLSPSPGAASLNLLRMAHMGLEVALRGALITARKRATTVRKEGLWVKHGGASREIALEVDPIGAPGNGEPLFVVSFLEPKDAAPARKGRTAKAGHKGREPRATRPVATRRVAELERELTATRHHLQGIVADRDEANETLQAMNEEAVSANEELQSLNEELSTAKEELQSVNEELNTVNDELGSRNTDLMRKDEDLQNLLAGVGAPVIVVDRRLLVRQVVPGAEGVFERNALAIGTDLIGGTNRFDFARVRKELEDVVLDGRSGAVPITRSDGRRYLLRVQPYRLANGALDGAVLVLFDVEEMEQRSSALQQTTEQMVMFSYSVSHDLRAPLRAMRGYAEALLDEAGPALDEPRRNYCHRMIEACNRLDALIQALLSFSRIGKVELLMAPVALGEVVRGVLEEMRGELEERHAEVQVEIPPQVPKVSAHAATLAQVVTNLISNAIKFVASDERPRVRVRAETRGGSVWLWVEDNGIGIAPRFHDRIFGPFERLHGSGDYSGVGIGLAFVKQAVARMQGLVGVDSVEHGGSRFWIALPAAAPGERPPDLLRPARGARGPATGFDRPRIFRCRGPVCV